MENQNHHYIPKAYLKRWSIHNPDTKEVWRYGFKNDRFISKKGSVRSVCSELDLYKRISVPEKEYVIETEFFKKLDDKANRVILKLIEKGILDLTAEDRFNLVAFILSLILRRPDSVRAIKKLSEERFLSFFTDTEFISKFLEAQKVEENHPNTPMQYILSNHRGLFDNFGIDRIPSMVVGINNHTFHEILLNMKWHIRDFSNCRDFLMTSDNPIYNINGLSHMDCQFAFPLSPTKAFFAFNRKDLYWKLIAEPADKIVEVLNEAVVKQAHNWVIDVDDRRKEYVCSNMGHAKFRNCVA